MIKQTELKPVSQYDPIWIQLKASGECRITAPIPLHKRIIKAVLKRKDVDIGYKVESTELGFKAKISYKSEGSTITFTLMKTKVYSFRDL